MRKNDRVCVSKYYPVDQIKANRMYIVSNCVLFIANGNIYINIRKIGDEKCYCCTIHNFKKWGGIENMKRFVSFKGKKEVKTLDNLIEAVIECGYTRKLGYDEFFDIENDSLLENSNYKYSACDLRFVRCEELKESDGFKKKEYAKTGVEGMIQNSIPETN